ncbi:MAG: HD domain-containing protein [Clostridia bacterium]|nr:HD domain-containing protein [Clostridia bacterium]
MEKVKNVVDFYVLCNKLKDVVRTGWQDWKVTRFRVESIAEHIYGTQMLALAIWSEFKYDLDIKKVILMLAIHELEETVIGDLTEFQIDGAKKEELGHQAVKKILNNLNFGYDIEKLILEFDDKATPEAKFAFWCDKLECNVQAKIYDEENCVDLNDQTDNKTAQNENVKKMLDKGYSWSQTWIDYGKNRACFDENFTAINDYVRNNTIKNK